ncbi:MAG TPA: response regulator [Burkholderiales bacterium]
MTEQATHDIRYRITQAGRTAWESRDPAVPADYRLILWTLDFHGEQRVRSLVQAYRKPLIGEWLAEMEELGLLERRPARAGAEGGLERIDVDRTHAFSEEEQRELRRRLQTASDSLFKAGKYYADERLAKRRAPAKPPAQSVVLIVEDDPDQLALADVRVTLAGYAVRVARSAGELARSLVEQGAPDVLLLDVMLPDGDGFDILRKLRAHPSYAALPVVMLTARSSAGDISTGLQLGADAYITKPYSKRMLAEVVGRVLGH